MLSIVMMAGLAFCYKAFAEGEFYERESTNEWFNVIAKDANLEDAAHWQTPTNEETSAAVAGDVIKLKADIDDPLTYKAGNSTAEVMVVNAHFKATAGKVTPSFAGEKPQAAITVIADEDGANHWWGLTGAANENDGWVKFVNETPVIDQVYDVKVELDLRENQARRIRYSVDGTVLKAGDDDGWYANPKAASDCISSVAFAGTGDVGDFAGSNIVWRAAPIEMGDVSSINGYDYTNGTLTVATTVREAGKAILRVIDFATGLVKESTLDIAAGTTQVGWDISAMIEDSLLPGAIYDYEVSLEAGGETVTQTGTFVSAGTDDWFHADATGNVEDVAGGAWEDSAAIPKPQIENGAYKLVKLAKFNVTEDSKGTNDLVVIDTHVVFEDMVDSELLKVDDGALGGFVAASNENAAVWMALTTVENETKWFALEGAAPEAGCDYVIRAEISFLEGCKKVRYLVNTKQAYDQGVDFVALSLNGKEWLALADDDRDTLESIEFEYASKLAKFTAEIMDRALAEVNGVKYYSMADAMAADGEIKLLTNVTVAPTGTGTWKFDKNGCKVFVDLSGVPGAGYTWSADGTLTVAIVKGATYLIW